MNEQIQDISTPGFVVQPSTPATQAGDENGERNRSPKLDAQETEKQLEAQNELEEGQGLSEKEIEELFSEAQEEYQKIGIKLNFTVHEETGQVQVEVLDSSDDRVIRKIPRDEMLKLSAQIKNMAGTLFDQSI